MDGKVLIVEDEILTATLLATELRQQGYQVCAPVVTGQKAVQVAKHERPDIILMDIRLPRGIDGIEAAEEICSWRKIPIVFMTGYSDEETRNRGARLNPVAFLVKPLELDVLMAVIEQTLN